MADVVIDTDVASLLQKGRAPAWVHASISGNRVWLTFVTVGELMKWTVVRSWGETRRERLDSWIANRPIIPYDRSVADQWGELAGAAQLRGRPRPQNDTWIAACCIRQNVPLITLNTTDFADFADNDGLILLGAD
ncbi:MAG: PIN domain-containing protein [Acidimicrobiales bacterium]